MDKALAILRFSWPFIRPYKMRLWISVFAAVCFGVSNAFVLWTIKAVLHRLEPPKTQIVVESNIEPLSQNAGFASEWIDGAMAKKETLQQYSEALSKEWLPGYGEDITLRQILGACLLVPLVAGFRGGMEFISKYGISWVGERVVNDLRIRVFGKLSGLSMDYFNRSKMGDMLTRINGDTAMLQVCLSSGVRNSITSPMTVISVFFLMLILDWQLTMSLFFILPFVLIAILVFGKKARKASRKAVETNVTQSSLIVEMLQSIRIVKAYGLESLQTSRFGILSRRLFGHTMKTIRSQEKVGPLVEFMGVSAMGGLILFVVATERSMSDMVVFFGALATFYSPVKKLANLHVLIEKTSIGVDRLMKVLDEKPSVTECESAVALSQFKRSISFENVSFAYDQAKVIDRLNLDIPRGQKLGIAGESGSGKSTLINLFFRFFDPTEGTIKLDGIDFRDYSQKELRQLMALVSQDVVVFDQTVFDNIGCGKEGSSNEAIQSAAMNAHADGFIQNLPEGYETILGERGTSLSGGQRQRISIARAFVRNAPILVLDEATAALDSASEGEVQNAIDELAKDRTVICIAHRLSTLQQMDRIIVLAEGAIVEDGSFDSLIQKGGVFASMAKRQGINSRS
ncbi:ABC transporter ATP-binding protein/permease [Verrucomicrobia bacterium]|nr:ABC transporter ATP-binding protein/permease [Verrucomicrobiota bacterium]MDC0264572.1 ABC transporter ATP-binding protein/permease [Verrucomicrobiota bacterium]